MRKYCMTNTFCLNPQYATTRKVTKDKCSGITEPIINTSKLSGGLRQKGYYKKNCSDKPLVSIISVIFNGEKDLEQSINSVINQSYDNIEYVIIDGGSTDNTINIIHKYNEAIDYWISEKDAGIYDAMNKGIAASSGEWLYFLGVDDLLFDHNTIFNVFKSNNYNKIDIVYGEVDTFPQMMDVNLPDKLSVSSLYLKTTCCHQSIFAHKSCLIEFDTKYKLAADLDWLFGVVLSGKKTMKIDQKIALYSLEGASTSNKDLLYEILDIYRKRINYIAYFAKRVMWTLKCIL